MKLRNKKPVRKPKTKVANPLKYDPSRTLSLRKSLQAEIKRRFGRLKAAIVKLVIDEDAFGLKDVSHDPFTADKVRLPEKVTGSGTLEEALKTSTFNVLDPGNDDQRKAIFARMADDVLPASATHEEVATRVLKHLQGVGKKQTIAAIHKGVGGDRHRVVDSLLALQKAGHLQAHLGASPAYSFKQKSSPSDKPQEKPQPTDGGRDSAAVPHIVSVVDGYVSYGDGSRGYEGSHYRIMPNDPQPRYNEPPPSAQAVAAKVAEVEKVLTESIAGLEKMGKMSVPALRQRVGGGRSFDEAVKHLWREKKVRLVAVGDLQKWTPRELGGMVPGVGEQLGLLEVAGKNPPIGNTSWHFQWTLLENYDPDQPRDDHGRFGEGGGDAKDAAIQDHRDKEDAARQEASDKEESAVNDHREAEDAALEKGRAAEEKAIDDARTAEDAKIASGREAEAEAVSSSRDAEDKQIQEGHDKEDEQISSARDKDDQDREDARAQEDDAVQESRDKVDEETAAHQAAEESAQEDRHIQEQDDLDSKSDRESWTDQQYDREQKALNGRQLKESATLTKQHEAVVTKEDRERVMADTKQQSARDKEDAQIDRAREKEDSKRESVREQDDKRLADARDKADAKRESEHERDDQKLSDARDRADRKFYGSHDKEDAARQATRDKEDEERQSRWDKEDQDVDDKRNAEDDHHGHGAPEVHNIATNAAWRFQPNPQKIKAFQGWLKGQVEGNITGLSGQQLMAKYAEQGLRKGAGRSFDDATKVERVLAGADKGKLDFYNGSKDQFLRSAFNQPVATDKIALLAGRSFDDLEGVTDEMSVRMSRTLTDGLVQGKSPRELAGDLTKQADISKDRALTMARTEIVRAHADGQLMALKQLGVEEVGVAVEWNTAGDDHVCLACAPLEGIVLNLDEARGMIPRHPNCRCAFVPANVGEDQTGQQDTSDEIQEALDFSLEVGPSDEEGDGSQWGPGDDIADDRPESILENARASLSNDNRYFDDDEGEYNWHRDQQEDAMEASRWMLLDNVWVEVDNCGGPGSGVPGPCPGWKGPKAEGTKTPRVRAVKVKADEPAKTVKVKAEKPPKAAKIKAEKPVEPTKTEVPHATAPPASEPYFDTNVEHGFQPTTAFNRRERLSIRSDGVTPSDNDIQGETGGGSTYPSDTGWGSLVTRGWLPVDNYAIAGGSPERPLSSQLPKGSFIAAGELQQGRHYDLKRLAIADLMPSKVADSPSKVAKFKRLLSAKKPLPPIVVDEDGTVRDGHHRLTAAKHLGMTNVWALKRKPGVANTVRQWQSIDNAFCPTGAGGGVDPSCGKGEGGGGDRQSHEDAADKTYAAATSALEKVAAVSNWLDEIHDKSLDLDKTPREREIDARAIGNRVNEVREGLNKIISDTTVEVTRLGGSEKAIEPLKKLTSHDAPALEKAGTAYMASLAEFHGSVASMGSDLVEPVVQDAEQRGLSYEHDPVAYTAAQNEFDIAWSIYERQEAERSGKALVVEEKAGDANDAFEHFNDTYHALVGKVEDAVGKSLRQLDRDVTKASRSAKRNAKLKVTGNTVRGWQPIDNAFCPTGTGGGVDPSCGKGEGGTGGGGGLHAVGEEVTYAGEKWTVHGHKEGKAVIKAANGATMSVTAERLKGKAVGAAQPAPSSAGPKAGHSLGGEVTGDHPLAGLTKEAAVQRLSAAGNETTKETNPFGYKPEKVSVEVLDKVHAAIKEAQKGHSDPFSSPTTADAYARLGGKVDLHTFQSAVLRLEQQGKVSPRPYTQRLSDVPHPEHLIPHNRSLKYYLRPTTNSEWQPLDNT